MADYKTLHGTNIDTVSSDPSNPVKGQVWYNSTAQKVKGSILSAGAWATANNMNTARTRLAGAGTQTAGLIFGGSNPNLNETETYDGTNWTEVANLNTARNGLGGAGTQTSAIGFGGEPTHTGYTETWNGSGWTEQTDLNTVRRYVGGAGADNTAALCFGGDDGPISANTTELWNGSGWTELADLNTARHYVGQGGIGTSTAALCVGGSPSPVGAQVESWNGTSWTEVADLNTSGNNACFGIQTSGLACMMDGSTATDEWDGSTWTAKGTMNNTRSGGGGLGVLAAGLAFGGWNPAGPAADNRAEEWTGETAGTIGFESS